MKAKQSGWVTHALELADEYAGAEYISEAGKAFTRLREFIESREAAFQEYSAAAEAMREALRGVLMWGANENYTKASEAVDAACKAASDFDRLKEK